MIFPVGATERSGGGAWPSPLRSCRQLWGRVPVDVLVEPALPRARVAREAPVEILRATLVDVGRRCVLVLRRLPRIRTLNGVPPVGPNAVRERPDRADVEVVATEGHRAAAELLVVRVARGSVQPRRRRPAQRRCRARGAQCVERHNGALIRAVPEWPRRAIALVVAAVPPDRVHAARIHRYVREALEPAAHARVVDQHRRRMDAGCAVEPEEVNAGLTAYVLVVFVR